MAQTFTAYIGRGKVVSQNFVGTTNEKELYLNDKRKL